jgi:hypothetical protein
MPLSDSEQSLLHAMADGIDACSICGEPAAYSGVFLPTRQFSALLGPIESDGADAQRVVIYALCEKCYSYPDKNERTEAYMLQAFAKRAAVQ